MSFEEEFDKIIRRKAEETEYPFDQNSWEKASSLLDAERKVTGILKFKRFYLPAALTVLIGSAGFVAYNFLSNDTDSNTLALQQKSEIEAKLISPATELKTDNLIEEANKTEAINKDVQSTANSKVTEVENKHRETKESGVKSIANNEIKVSAKDSEISAVVIKQKQVESSSTKTKNYPVAVKKSSENQAVNTFSNVKNEGTVSEDSSSPNSTVSQKKSQDKVLYNIPPSTPANSDGLAKQKDSNNIGEGIATDAQEPKLAANTEIASQEELVVIDAEKLNAVHSLIPINLYENDLMPTEFICLNRYDDDYYKNSIAPKKQYLNFGLGANYLLGWDASGGKDGQGLNWFAGFNYGRYLSKKVDISFGIQAYNIANIKQPFYIISEKEYGFGSTDIYTRVTTSQLYYLAIPLAVNYAINSNNSIGLGVNAAYLLNAKSTVAKYYLLDNEEKTIASASSNGMTIYKGTSMTNFMLSASYKTQLTKRVGLNLEFNYGLTDIFQNEGIINTKESPMGIRLGLHYTLFDK